MTDELKKAVERDFGSLDNMKAQLSAMSVAVQGSGWGWLGYNRQTSRLQLATTFNQDLLEPTHGTCNTCSHSHLLEPTHHTCNTRSHSHLLYSCTLKHILLLRCSMHAVFLTAKVSVRLSVCTSVHHTHEL